MKETNERLPDRETVIRDLRSIAQMAAMPHLRETCMAAAALIEQGTGSGGRAQ